MAEVLQHLMSVNDVKGSGGKLPARARLPLMSVTISHIPLSDQRLGRRNRGRRCVDARDDAVGQPVGEIDRDGSWANPDIEQPVVGVSAEAGRYAAEFAAVRHRCDRRTESMVTVRIDLAGRVRHQESVSARQEGWSSGSGAGVMRKEFRMDVLHVDCDTCAAQRRGLQRLRRQRAARCIRRSGRSGP